MMSSAKVEFCRLERPIEVYENERFWIGRGFSKVGLLPTERGPYSTKDGSLSWKAMREASLALLRWNFVAVGNGNGKGKGKGSRNGQTDAKRIRRGWSFHEEDNNQINANDSDKENLRKEDEYECSTESSSGDNVTDKYCGFVPCKGPEDGPTDDKEGWQYFPDFSPQSLLTPNRKRGILDFVRRRKLRRVAVFRPDHFLPREVYTKCDYCDSIVVNMLSSSMLDALALATLFAHGPKNNVSDAQALPLKSKLIDSLSIGGNCTNHNQNYEYDPGVDINKVKDRLRTFAETCVGKPGPLTQLLNPDVDQNVVSAMPGRRKEMARYFNDQERLSLARLLVKDVDRYSYKMHCMDDSCACVLGETIGNLNRDDEDEDNLNCEFRLVPCPNPNCNASFSYKYQAQHDDECGFKLLPCPSGCGAMVPRNEVHIHVRDICSMRHAECPLSIVGCTAIVQAQDISSHLNNHADKHFMLVASRMMEYQSMIKEMSTRIRLLEEKNEQLDRELKRTVVQLQSKSEAKVISGNVKKLTKRLGTLESACSTEFKKMEYERRNQRK